MNDNPIPDAAIEALRERTRQLDTDIAQHTRSVEVATACRDELLDVIATLSRKPRARSRPRLSSVSVTLDGALTNLGLAVAANDAAAPEDAA